MSPKYKQLNLEGLEENMDTKVADEKIVAETTKEIHHVRHLFLGINKGDGYGPDGDKPRYEVEEILEGYYRKGYKILHVQVSDAPGFYQMMYVLVRE